MSNDYHSKAAAFVTEEKAFHLGFLPTEQSNPLTRGLDLNLSNNTAAGVRMLQRVDREVLAMAEKVLSGPEFKELVEAGIAALTAGRKIVFSGCGATGRLSILLESMWRRFFVDLQARQPETMAWAGKLENAVESIMTGGDYALIRSVEFFEDYAEFGRQQVREAQMTEGDVLVAITEGGETSSVLGTVDEAVRRGARAFLLFNNPAELLRAKLERSRQAIEHPAVTVLDLYCGPMAIAGSTRMQATTAEQLTAGAALEQILAGALQRQGREGVLAGYRQPEDYAAEFAALLDELEAEPAVAAMAGYIDFEADIYARHGLITYIADDYLLDIFTDTTERSPTFMLPPFRKQGDEQAPSSWAFVKHPELSTGDAWRRCLARSPRCLGWTAADYERMGAAAAITDRPPKLDGNELMKFVIGAEDSPERHQVEVNAAVMIQVGASAAPVRVPAGYARTVRLAVGGDRNSDGFVVPCLAAAPSPLQLMAHLAVKLVLNTISTGTMVKLGRVESNWMSWVDVSNKKLIDRGIRLIAELTGRDYAEACTELFRSIEELQELPIGTVKPSPVQHTIRRLRNQAGVTPETLLDWELAVALPPAATVSYCAAEMMEKSVCREADAVTAVWRGHAVLGAEFTVTVRWEARDNGLYAGTFSYANYADQRPVEAIRFPIVRSPLEEKAGFLVTDFDLGVIHREPEWLGPGKTREGCYGAMQFAALLNPTRNSVYYDHRDSNNHGKGYLTAVSADGRTFTYAGVHWLPVALPLKEYRIPYENVCGEFRGGWFEAGQLYRPWALQQAWHTGRTEANPMREIGMWVWNRGLAAEVIPPVKQLAEACGVPVALDWYWWHHNPYDTDYPDFWPPREGEEKFRAAIADLKQHGIFSQVYINGVCWDMDTPSWSEGGAASVVIQKDGEPTACEFNKYNHHRLGFMCGEAPKFHDRLAALVKKLRASGLDGQYLDMIGMMRSSRCYNPAHRHAPGGGNHTVAGYRELLQRLKQENPGFMLSTEYANEAYMDLLDGAIICASASAEHMGIDGEFVPLFTAVYHGKLALFGSYAFPDNIPPWDPLWPAEDRWQEEKPWHQRYPDQFFIEMARPVIWGAQPMVCNLTKQIIENPEFREHCRFIRETARFYYVNREFLFDGVMCSPDGFECADKEIEFMARMIFTKESECRIIRKRQPVILHSVWQNSSDKKALFMVNYTAAEQIWRYDDRSGAIPAHTWQTLEL